MGSFSETFTLSELGKHVCNEAIRADAQMELNQRHLWMQLIRKNLELANYEGMGAPQYLGLESLKYNVALEPARGPWWKRALWAVGINRSGREKYQGRYVIPRKRSAKPLAIEVEIVLTRGEQGEWQTKYQSEQLPEIDPNQIHVA